MTRGNQREIDRARAQARDAKNKPKEGREGTPAARNEADALALAAKIEAKRAKAAAEAAAGGGDAGGGGGGGGGGGKGGKK